MSDDELPPWQPLTVRDTEAAASYEALVDGVPAWLERSIWRWIMHRDADDRMELVYRAERLLRIRLHRESSGDPQVLLANYWNTADDAERLNFIDFMLHDMHETVESLGQGRDRAASADMLQIGETIYRAGRRAAVGRAAELDAMLKDGGSLWTVALEPRWGLVRRVNETTQAHVDLASSTQTDAARKIASAWNACFRPDPNYDTAYRDAVLAVEAVTIPATLPRSNRATLGTVVQHIADTVEHWTVGGLDAPQQQSGETLLGMLRMLWHNQQRHASGDGTIRDVSGSEAEVAVGLAVTLVHWFSTGLAHRRDGD